MNLKEGLNNLWTSDEIVLKEPETLDYSPEFKASITVIETPRYRRNLGTWTAWYIRMHSLTGISTCQFKLVFLESCTSAT